jgi:hypothetical protein
LSNAKGANAASSSACVSAPPAGPATITYRGAVHRSLLSTGSPALGRRHRRQPAAPAPQPGRSDDRSNDPLQHHEVLDAALRCAAQAAAACLAGVAQQVQVQRGAELRHGRRVLAQTAVKRGGKVTFGREGCVFQHRSSGGVGTWHFACPASSSAGYSQLRVSLRSKVVSSSKQGVNFGKAHVAKLKRELGGR